MLLTDIYFTRILRCLICSLRTGTVYIKKMVLRVRSQAGTQGDLTSAPGFAAVFFLYARIFVLVIQTFIHKDTFYVSDSQSCATITIIKILEITFKKRYVVLLIFFHFCFSTVQYIEHFRLLGLFFFFPQLFNFISQYLLLRVVWRAFCGTLCRQNLQQKSTWGCCWIN